MILDRQSLYSIFLHLSLAALAVMVLVLARQNRTLRSAAAPPVRAALEIGQAIEPLSLTALDGHPRRLSLAGGDRDHLLLVFTTTCPACQANQQAWRTLSEGVGDAVEVVGISLDEIAETRAYTAAHDLPFPVTIAADRDHLAEVLGISAIPMTIRIGRDGRVRGSWLGALSADQLAEARLPAGPPGTGADPQVDRG